MKSDVDQKLLPKEEIIVEVEMTHLQKRYYRAIFERNLSLLKTSAPTSSSKKSARDSQISLRNVSMQLRKCCDHPYLLEGVEDEVLHTLRDERKRGVEPTSDFGFVPTPHQNGAASVNHNTAPGHVTVTDDDIYRQLILASGKLVLLDKLLAKLLRTGHKVLIFSQMTRVLDLLQDYCQYRNYQTERLDGNIKGSDRQEAIDRFSRPQSSSFIFLLSTRAGGVGLTLTAADTVILFDCDWNPQVFLFFPFVSANLD
jgi:SNF2 family DNA or RNA helicase